MMKNPFRPDADLKLRAAEQAIEQAEARLVEVRRDRATALATDGDFLGEVAKLDREAAQLTASLGVQSERVAALHVKRQAQIRAELEREKAAGIVEHSKRLAKMLDAARKLDAAHRAFAQAFVDLTKAADDAAANYPASVSPLGSLPHFGLDGIEPLSARRRPRPPSVGIARQFAEHAAFGIADTIEARNRECIELLESAPLSDMPDELEAA
jgi:hypothetical protein